MIKAGTQTGQSSEGVAVAVVAMGAREARGCRRGGLSVPKPPKGVVDGRCPATATATTTSTPTTFRGYRGIRGQDPPRVTAASPASQDWQPFSRATFAPTLHCTRLLM
jgi:hypothetical protein